MAASYSRHGVHYAPPSKTLPITMPSKAPALPYPTSRVAMSPPEYSDSSVYSSQGSRHSPRSYSARSSTSHAPSHSDYDVYRESDRDVSEMLSKRMHNAFDPITMDRSLAKQAQDSGKLNSKERELRELQERARARLKTARVNFAQGVEDAREVRRDLDYCKETTQSVKSKAERHHSDAYAKASKSRSRHAS
ncbi:uncharacterized protein HMPREF1541_03330 [Cyphellophora europaea CBS 101466]|uniref:Biogenesis of lysosome-related organelles complex 1 subunit KXD1 n=1 Tax=Cyphellophora europaea (strain CBS 101466) TaxID=1220924 RepID=W2RYK4_CYPE1|nr:uncharacterized protein HMPREF1541_03330 [Cyphellophora europaea CBS 101466]ETN41395.1 hypothetical protein HMPREF1541_03330 [Cyphellophora europaea CBS 101466]